MNTEYDSRSPCMSEATAIHSIMPRIARLALAVFIALVVLISLCGRLSEARRQVQASHTAATTRPSDGPSYALCAAAQDVPTRCHRPALSITKQIDPAIPDTGGVVTITFIITGLGLKRVDVVLVQDVSGSMGERDTPSGQSRLEFAKAAAITFVSELSHTDRVAVVAYNDTAWLVQPLISDTNVVTRAINGLTASGWTNIGDGIRSAYEELITSTRYHSRTVKAMVLLSDGNANRRINDPEGYARYWARAAGDCGILIYTIGLGDLSEGDPDLLVNQELLQTIAYTTGGEYYYSPDGTNLGTIYKEIALELRNLEITDVLSPGVGLDCNLLPAAWKCITGSGFTTITIPISNSELITNPWVRSFTATVNLDPRYEGPINASGSDTCYDGPGGPTCSSFENPTATVGGRKIAGIVFEDLDRDGHFDLDEERGLPGVVVTTSNGLTGVTDISGVYVLRTSTSPTLTVAISIPANYVTTTSEITHIPPLSDTYQQDFGLYTGLVGEKHSLDINGPPLFEGDILAYTVTVHNISTTLYTGVVITDAIPISTSYVGGSAHITPSGTVTVAGRTLTGNVSELLSKSLVSLTFRVTVDAGTAGQEIVRNQARVTSTVQRYHLCLDEERPHRVEPLPIPHLSLATSAQVVGPGTEVIYTYTASNPSTVVTLTDIIVTDSHLGSIPPTHFSLPPDRPVKVLSATISLTQNTTSTATITSGVEGYSGTVSGNPATITVHTIEGISLNQPYTQTLSPEYYHGDVATLYYSVTNQDVDDGVISGTILITDTLGRVITTTLFERMGPSSPTPLFSQAFTVPRDIMLTLTAVATDDIQRILTVSDEKAIVLCPIDFYEQGDGDDGDNPFTVKPIAPSIPQIHDFSKPEDEDWVGFKRAPGYKALYTFIAHPLLSEGVAISLTFEPGSSSAKGGDNLDNIKSDVRLTLLLDCDLSSPQPCEYKLQVKSPVRKYGCWTDYELRMSEITWGELRHIWLPVVLRNF